jgi:hypothetical protein
MAVAGSDIRFLLGVSAAAGAAAPQPDPAASLGGCASTTPVAGGALSLFDDVAGTENAAGAVDYRCVFVHNAHPTDVLLGAVAWLSAQAPGGAGVELGVDPTPASPVGAAAPQAVSVGGEADAPPGVAFVPAATRAAGVALGNLPAGYCRAVWARRTAAGTAAAAADGATVRVDGETLV